MAAKTKSAEGAKASSAVPLAQLLDEIEADEDPYKFKNVPVHYRRKDGSVREIDLEVINAMRRWISIQKSKNRSDFLKRVGAVKEKPKGLDQRDFDSMSMANEAIKAFNAFLDQTFGEGFSRDMSAPMLAEMRKSIAPAIRARLEKFDKEDVTDVTIPQAKAQPPVAPKNISDDNKNDPDLTTRGTPRVRRKMRSAQELGGNPKSEEHRYDAKLGGRVPKELKEAFLQEAERRGLKQGEALAQALQEFLQPKND